MAFKCKIGLHNWNKCKCNECGKTRDKQHEWYGCKCYECGKIREEQHDWSNDCEKCSRCGKTREEQHDWNDCKCSKCGKTRDEQHDWSKDCEKCSRCGLKRKKQHKWKGCKCKICGLEHDWNNYICTKCDTVGYLALLNRMYEIARIGNIVINSSTYAKSNDENKDFAFKEFSECKTDSQKQELVLQRFNYLVTVVKKSFGSGSIYMATDYLIEIQPTIEEIGRRHKKDKLS